MNRARSNPSREGSWLATDPSYDVAGGREWFNVNTSLLQSEFNAIASTPPAAFDRRLYSAALAHANALIARDDQDHIGQLERVTSSGFNWREYRGNVFSYADNAVNAHAAFNIDWGYGAAGMQDGRGHRKAVMSTDGKYTNVGIASVAETNAATEVGENVVVGNYCRAWTSTANHYNEFIVGTVYADLNYNGRYDIGEGQSGVYVFPSKGDYYAVTSAGGGYSIPVTWQGTASIRFGGDEVEDHSVTVTETGESQLVDYVTNTANLAEDVFPSVFLQVGEREDGDFGYRWGSNNNPVSVKAEFNGTGRDLSIGARGFDIDATDEVQVLLNGVPVGYLSPTVNSRTGSTQDWFTLSKSDLKATNVVEFRQKTPSQKWGVTDLELRDIGSSDLYLPIGAALDTDVYGWPNGRPGVARFRFNASWQDLVLRVHGYDVDQGGEVAVYVNNVRKGWLTQASKNEVGPKDQFSIFRSELNANGQNIIEFRSAQPWQTWGVTKIGLTDASGPQVQLLQGASKTGAFGKGYGSGAHKINVRTSFRSDGKDVRYRYSAYAIEAKKEVSVFLNNQFIGYAPKASASTATNAELFFPASILNWGENIVEFRRDNPSGSWGVDRVAVSDITVPATYLKVGEIDRTRYGWGRSDYLPARGVKRYYIDADGNPIRLVFKAWDIDTRDEVAVYLNGERVDTKLLVAGDNQIALNEIIFSADQLKLGANTVEFVVNEAVDKNWGVHRLEIVNHDPADPRESSDIKAAASDEVVTR